MLELLEAGQRPTDMAGSETVAWEGQSDQARTYGHRQQPKDARGQSRDVIPAPPITTSPVVLQEHISVSSSAWGGRVILLSLLLRQSRCLRPERDAASGVVTGSSDKTAA